MKNILKLLLCGILLFYGTKTFCSIKMLHITFHEGCLNEIKRVAEHFNIDLTSIRVCGCGLRLMQTTCGPAAGFLTMSLLKNKSDKY